jgi:hypothetical protein
MISTTHAVFRGLQQELQKLFGTLPDNVVPQLKLGIISAHTKLSDYYTKFDESPLYTWAGCMCHLFTHTRELINTVVPDPRISYEGMNRDYSSDADLAAYLECVQTVYMLISWSIIPLIPIPRLNPLPLLRLRLRNSASLRTTRFILVLL